MEVKSLLLSTVLLGVVIVVSAHGIYYVLLSLLIRKRKKSTREVKRALSVIILFATVIVVVALVFYYVMPLSPVGKPLSVDSVQTTGGDQIVITQRFTGTTEPYEVSLYVKPEGIKQWYWFYLDHEALYWRARIVLDSDKELAHIIKGGRTIAKLDWRKLRLTWMDDGRIIEGPQGVLSGEPTDPNAFLSISPAKGTSEKAFKM